MVYEDAVEETYEGQSLKCAELAADTEHHGWKTVVCPVDVSCRGFIGKSTTRLLKDMVNHGQAKRQAIKALSSAAD